MALTTITVSRDARDRLARQGAKGDSFETIVSRLLGNGGEDGLKCHCLCTAKKIARFVLGDVQAVMHPEWLDGSREDIDKMELNALEKIDMLRVNAEAFGLNKASEMQWMYVDPADSLEMAIPEEYNEDTERIRENYRSFLAVLESVRGTSDMPLVNRPNRAERRRRAKENRK